MSLSCLTISGYELWFTGHELLGFTTREWCYILLALIDLWIRQNKQRSLFSKG